MKKRLISLLLIATLSIGVIGVFSGCGNAVTVYFYNSAGWDNVEATASNLRDGSRITHRTAIREGDTNFWSVRISRNPSTNPFAISFSSPNTNGGSQSVIINNRTYVFVTMNGGRYSTREDARTSANIVVQLDVEFARDAVAINTSMELMRSHLTVTATYLDGTSRELERYEYDLRGAPFTRVGYTQVTVRYQNRDATIEVRVDPRYVRQFTAVFDREQAFGPYGTFGSGGITTATVLNTLKRYLAVTMHFSDDTYEIVAANHYSLYADLSEVGDNQITVRYRDLEATFYVAVTYGGPPPNRTGIEVDFAQGSRRILTNPEVLDVVRELITVNAIYADGQYAVLGMMDFDLEISDIIAGTQEITVTYQDNYIATFMVNLTHAVRFHLFNYLEWEGPIFAYAYYYTILDLEPLGPWLGTVLTPEGNGWYFVDIPANPDEDSFEMYFHNNGIDRIHSVITSSANPFFTNKNGTQHPTRESAEIGIPPMPDYYTRVWFLNSGGWAQPMMHAWYYPTAGNAVNLLGSWGAGTQNMRRDGETNWWYIIVPRCADEHTISMIIRCSVADSNRATLEIDSQTNLYVTWGGGNTSGVRHPNRAAAEAAVA
ncbi:MAG: bacterial Ig-like domain-containing protein [Firmicutes bacterium]|nr:bacterial Ig-like domain-containing protein [Bacillota bacterium]